MGSIASKSAAIDGLYFTQLRKGQVYDNCKVLRTDDNDYVIQKANGQCHAIGHSKGINGSVCILDFGASFPETVLSGLVRMGVLTEEDRQVHYDAVEARKVAREAKYAELAAEDLVKKLGKDRVLELVGAMEVPDAD